MKSEKSPFIIAVTFLWIGFVCAISFMEAWLKFRAPGVTLPLGLSIGRLVFYALNKVEWVFAVLIFVNLFLKMRQLLSTQNMLFFIPLIVLMLQSVWALPALDARAELHIQGQSVAPSFLHFYYVALEVIKVSCLTIFGITLLNK